MDSGIWKMQQEARVRVATQRAREHRVMEEENRRTAASLRAARPPEHKPAPPMPEPPKPVPIPKPTPAMDGEQIMLLLLALLLSQAGASKMLVIALLYLAM